MVHFNQLLRAASATLASFAIFSIAPEAHADVMPELLEISEAQDEGVDKDSWPGHNSPSIFNSDYNFNYRTLMTRPQGRISDDKMPWSDTWWPGNQGGIAGRWQVSEAYPRITISRRDSENRARIMRMSADQIRLLSPAEKYDIAVGDYGFGLTRRVLSENSPTAPDWFGICNGWTSAAMAHREPAPTRITNPDGLQVQFGSSDVKGLLAHFYAWDARSTRQLGHRCSPPSGIFRRGGDCQDVHAASFHVVLLNQIGFLNQTFGADVDGRQADDSDFLERGVIKPYREYQYEVWNQPVFAYSTEQVSEEACNSSRPCRNAASGTVKRVRIRTIMTYADDDHPVWRPSLGTNDFFQQSRLYEYWLEIDFRGNIVGGSWISQDRPDYLYMARAVPFRGDHAGLSRIYRAAPTRAYCVPRAFVEGPEAQEVIYPVNPICPDEASTPATGE